MNKITRRLYNYGVFCDQYKTEIRTHQGTTGKFGYRVLLPNNNIQVWICGDSLYSFGFCSPDSINEIIDRFGDKPRKGRKL